MGGSHPRVLTLSPKELLVLELLRHQDLYGLQLVAASRGRLKRGTVYVTLGRTLGHRMFMTWNSGAKQLVPELGR